MKPHIHWKAEMTAAFLAFTAFALLFTWPLAAHLASRIILFWGDPVLNAYVIAWDQYALLHCPTHVMSAPFLQPFPVATALSENLLGAAALGLPFAASGNPLLVYNAILILSFPLAGAAWYAVLRRWGLVRSAAWFGAFAFAFLPWRFSQISHLQLILTWWIPPAVGAAERWVRTDRWRPAVLMGVSGAMMYYLCVYNTFFLLLFLAAFVVAGWLTRWRRRPRWFRRWAQVAGSSAIAVALILPVLPAYLQAKRAIPEVNPLSELAVRGAALADYLQPPPANRMIGWLRRFPNQTSDVPWEHELYLGALAALLALSLPLLLRIRPRPLGRSLRGILVMIAAGTAACFVISLGPVFHWNGHETGLRLPYELLHRFLPGFASLRVPSRAALLVGLGLTALAAIALHGWLVVLGRQSKRAAGMVAGVAAVLLAVELWAGRLPVEGNPDYVRHVAVQERIAKRERGTILVVPRERRLDYLVPLTTTSHFYPLVNGISGYLPPACKPGYNAFIEAEWGPTQIAMLRDLDVRYLLEDHRQPERVAFPDGSLEESLVAAGIVAETIRFPDEAMTLFVLGDPEAAEASARR